MFALGITEITAATLVAARIDRLPESSAWLLNDLLRSLDEESRAAGCLTAWRRSQRDVVGYCPAVVGVSSFHEDQTVDHVVRELLGDRSLVRHGQGLAAELVVTDKLVRQGRAVLFRAVPEDATALYGAGRRLASRLSASAKKRASVRSSGTDRSGSPLMRLHSVPGL